MLQQKLQFTSHEDSGKSTNFLLQIRKYFWYFCIVSAPFRNQDLQLLVGGKTSLADAEKLIASFSIETLDQARLQTLLFLQQTRSFKCLELESLGEVSSCFQECCKTSQHCRQFFEFVILILLLRISCNSFLYITRKVEMKVWTVWDSSSSSKALYLYRTSLKPFRSSEPSVWFQTFDERLH